MTERCRLYPTSKVEVALTEHCAHERFLFNLAVEQFEFALRHRPYRAGKRQSWPSPKTRSTELTELRKELGWLAAGSRKVQTQALRIVDQAYRNWWSNPGHFRRPTFRSRHGTQGFSVVGAGQDFAVARLNRRWAQIRLPKTGWVRFRVTRNWPIIAATRSARITCDRAGRWWVTFPAAQPTVNRSQTGAAVGVDRGVVNTVATSDGRFGTIPGLSAGEAERLIRLERRIARQTRGSRRRAKTCRAKARLQARAADRRRDWIEKSTTALVRDHDLIAIERLQVKNMVRSGRGGVERPGINVAAKRGLNRSIHGSAWSQWATRLRQKADTCGVLVVEVPAANTSRRCAACGHVAEKSRESQAAFSCVACGHEANADTNAAINILRSGIARSSNAARQVVSARGDLQASAGSVSREPVTPVAA